MRAYLMLLIVSALASCTTVRTTYDAASNSQLHEIGCAGPAPMNWNSCQRKADKVCPSGWSIVSTTRDSTAAVSVGGDRRMTVRCKAAAL